MSAELDKAREEAVHALRYLNTRGEVEAIEALVRAVVQDEVKRCQGCKCQESER